jgi:hypothetical protein
MKSIQTASVEVHVDRERTASKDSWAHKGKVTGLVKKIQGF